MAEVFLAHDYRAFLKATLKEERFGHGVKGKLARSLGVQPSFLSSVFAGKQDLSLEHGLKAAEFLAFSEDESDFLLLLIQKERSGSQALRRHFQKQIEAMLKKRSRVRERIDAEKSLNPDEHIEYFSSWRHPAVLMAVRNPSCRNLEFLEKYLGIRRDEARESIDLLVRFGLVVPHAGGWKPTVQRLHLDRDSMATKASHIQWRHSAVRSLDKPVRKDDLHYSAVISTDRETAKKLRDLFLSAVEKSEPLIVGGGDSEIQVLALDFFRLSQ
jgi:uncharacterized protein (TIGR02147 family)